MSKSCSRSSHASGDLPFGILARTVALLRHSPGPFGSGRRNQWCLRSQRCNPGDTCRCMEEMGDWGKVLEVINSENSETAAEDGAGDPSDERLFLKEEGWDGPKYLRYNHLCCLSLVVQFTLCCPTRVSVSMGVQSPGYSK